MYLLVIVRYLCSSSVRLDHSRPFTGHRESVELAAEADITLTDRHWVVLDFVRKDAEVEGEPPGVRRITKLTDVSMKEMYKLFPKGPGILASKLAGYGKPQGCV